MRRTRLFTFFLTVVVVSLGLTAAAAKVSAATTVSTLSSASGMRLGPSPGETRVDTAPPNVGIPDGQSNLVSTGAGEYLFTWLESGTGSTDKVMSRRSVKGTLGNVVPVNTAPPAEMFSNPHTLARGQDVYVIWTNLTVRNPDFEQYELRFTHSGDGGATWEPDRNIIPAALSVFGANAELAVGPGHDVYVALAAFTGFETGYQQFFLRSSDSGATWSDPVRVDTAARGSATLPTIAADFDGNIVLAWRDFRSNPQQLRATRSTDRGLTWLAQDVQVSPREPGAIQLAAEGSNRFFLAFDTAPAPALVLAWGSFSTDAGASWSAPARLDTNDTGIEPFKQESTSNGAGHVYVAMTYRTFSVRSLYFRESDDGGATFHDPVRLDAPTSGVTSIFPREVNDSGASVAVGWAALSGGTGPGQVFAVTSIDDGSTWTEPAQLGSDTPVPRYYPQMALETGGLAAAVSWVDGNGHLYYNTIVIQ